MDTDEAEAFVNEHVPYGQLTKPDRKALQGVLATAFPLGKSSHKLWNDFYDTTAFLRRSRHPTPDGPPAGVVAGAIVMGYAIEQYDHLAYLAVLPELRRRPKLPWQNPPRHRHGTHLVRYVYDVMFNRVTPEHPQQYLMIEPSSDDAIRFYFKALPTNEYALRFFEEERLITVAYDGLRL